MTLRSGRNPILVLTLLVMLCGAFAATQMLQDKSAGAAAGFSPPVAIPGATVTEPGINVAPDGAIYVNGPAGLLSSVPGSASPVFKSTDGGVSWVTTDPSLRANFPGGGDSNISIDRTSGTLYMTDLWLGSATVSRSTDGAASWLANPLEGVVVQDRQWVAAAGGDVYHVTHQIPAGLIVSKSVSPLDGLVYPQNTIAATPADQGGCVCPPGNLIAAAGGLTGDKVGVIYSTAAGGVNFAHSANGGLTFTNTPVGPATTGATDGNFPVVADAGGGHLVATWTEVDGNTDKVLYNESRDWGATWGNARTLVASGTSVYPWIAAQGSKVSISLYHTDEVATPDTVSAAAQWFESYLESTDGGATFSALSSIDPIAAKTGIVCTGGINCTTGREFGDFQSVTLDNAGRANVSYDRVSGSGTQTMFDRQG
ncbi:MAG: exo-alpha-sialidase [Actinomycetia bacterium]|nr:exo-alpha-sialidase [Actinomycetes bacterium]